MADSAEPDMHGDSHQFAQPMDPSSQLAMSVRQIWEETAPLKDGELELPSQAYLISFRDQILDLARLISAKKVRPPAGWAAVELVAKRFPKWELDRLIKRWVDSFHGVPISPGQKLDRWIQSHKPERSEDVQQLLDSLASCRLPKQDLLLKLHDVWPILLPFASQEYLTRHKQSNFAPPTLKSDLQAPKPEVFARWALVTDLLAQQADWRSRYDRFAWFPAWVAAWQNDELTEAVRHHLPQNRPQVPLKQEDRRRRLGVRRILRHRGVGGFKLGDILDLEGLSSALRAASDPVAAFIVSRMSAQGRQELSSPGSSSPLPRSLETTLLQELTRICHGPCIYEKERFSHVPLRPETKTRLGSKEMLSGDFQTIEPGSLENATSVAAALKSPANEGTGFIFETLTAETREALDNWPGQGDLPKGLVKRLVNDLNDIILGSSIWEESRFAGVIIPWHVKPWVDFGATGPQIAQLNRLLLEQLLPLHRVAAFRKSLFRLNRILLEDAFSGQLRSTGHTATVAD